MIASLFAVAIVPVSADTTEPSVPTDPPQPGIGDVASDYKPGSSAIAIKTAEEFAAMSATGNYYLANDIDLSTLATPFFNGCFKGNFDGCGHTIKLNGYAAFRTVDWTNLPKNYIKNLKLEGTVTTVVPYVSGEDATGAYNAPGKPGYLGAVTQVAKGGNYENILNNADITNTTDTINAGGIYGVNHWFAINIKNCQNAGDITVLGAAGGIAAFAMNEDTTNTATITGCINTGKITSNGSLAGGLVARASAKSSGTSVKITDCTNKGKVEATATGKYAGGILAQGAATAYIENCQNNAVVTSSGATGGIVGNATDDNSANISILKCVNTGRIESTASYAAGILGRGRHNNVIDSCVNTGSVKAYHDQAAGIAAYHWGNNAILTISKCVNQGKVTIADASVNNSGAHLACGILGNAGGTYSAFTFTYNINAGDLVGPNRRGLLNTNNKSLNFTANDNYYLEGVGASNNTVVTAGTAVSGHQIESGEVARKLNATIGATVFYQEIGTDKAPFLDSSHGLPNPPKTGDQTPVFILTAIALVSLIGAALVIKKMRTEI